MVYLQTLSVIIRGDKEIVGRLLIDTGSQRSYIRKEIAEELGYQKVSEESLVHALFGGTRSEKKRHSCYKVRVKSIKNNYMCRFDVLDEENICNTIPKLEKGVNEVENYVIQRLFKCFYVDNCVVSLESLDLVNKFKETASSIFAQAKFDLRGWEWNDVNIDDSTALSSVLGLLWDRKKDLLYVNSANWRMELTEIITRRVILSMAQRVFDTIGFTCPVSLRPKLLLQRSWKAKEGWDDEVSIDVRDEFRRWVKQLVFLEEVNIPRWLAPARYEEKPDVTLHLFCDASKVAYAAAVFLRIETTESVEVNLVQAKTRVAPLKPCTIPRLELLAATVGSRLMDSMLRELDFENVVSYCWSDSSTVITWIQREDFWNTFVKNRVVEIRKNTLKESWKYVPGEMNPADLPSRGCFGKKLVQSKWWEGPLWLKGPKESWPSQTVIPDEEVVLSERKKVVVTNLVCDNDDQKFYKKFSRYNKIIRVIGWIRRFFRNSRKDRTVGDLQVEELEEAEECLMKLIQREAFNNVKDKKIISLSPFKDEKDVMRVKTKIANREDTEYFRLPILVPHNHVVVERLIYDSHVKHCHAGVQYLMSLLREKFWIPKARKTIRSVINKCVVCRRYDGKSFTTCSPPLPSARVSDINAFEVTGVDFAGPVILKNGGKAWICVFTCAVYRAVHFELVSSLSTEAFLLALRRFIARRGRPKIIYSDNATNFKGTENILSQLDWNEIIAKGLVDRIEWRFNSPTAAWWGGWWERIVGLLKRLLRRVLGRAAVTDEEMYTILCECEAIINSRPITHMSEDNKDPIPLSPSMFIQDIKETGVKDLDKVSNINFNRRWKYKKRLKEELRGRFRLEYLGQLSTVSGKKGRRVEIGELVFVASEHKRMEWPLAIVEEVVPGPDGEVRLVKLRMGRSVLLRPIQNIYPLEVKAGLTNQFGNPSDLEDDKMECELPSDAGLARKEQEQPKTTRSGRALKKPRRYL